MISITFRGHGLDITTPEERALRTLRIGGNCGQWTAPKSHFEEGPRKWRRYILPDTRRTYSGGGYKPSRASVLGVSEEYRPHTVGMNPAEYPNSKRAARFLEKNKRHTACIVGNPRRINAILQAIDTIRAAKAAGLEIVSAARKRQQDDPVFGWAFQ